MQRAGPDHVRFGSTPDMAAAFCDVRFTPKSRHPSAELARPLRAKSGHRPNTIGSPRRRERALIAGLSEQAKV